ncbi:PIG-L family deacetylase [Umezawaea tangerina]|uniref:LmbE family N-acetylglucosaminyl deacetylase n=1 Tax=Umezawaea tangerina TaxID=84725 RepID=A0A2T0SMD0_9PSEU|nr:PIG-L family deacetylase [Umezawaea tangerina]PRY34570.1 LmbE family N-acetylglucosaminyl deacetylase [Umezawaea tangerina]
MATLVSFHAHPDDECILCGGVMRKAADEGHRVVLVVATRGEVGEVAEGFLDEGELLRDRRVRETHASAEILGAKRVEFLGYVDSGMMGEPTNDAPDTFWTASVEEAAGRLAAILVEEAADVLTVYDDHGGYGHPDHIQVHRVGMRAAELAGTPRVYQATMNRDHARRGWEAARAAGIEVPDLTGDNRFGTPETELTTAVDVTGYADVKRAAMRAHASQISEQSFFLGQSEEAFAHSFGTEWFIRVGAEPGIVEDDLLTGL